MARILYSVFLCLIISVIFPDTVIAQTWSDNGEDKDSHLRSMLMTVREQNRRLELQNNRLQKIWLGMHQMCSALEMATCECEDRDKNIGKERETKEDSEPIQNTFEETPGLVTDKGNVCFKTGEDSEPIQITFVESSGLVTGNVYVTVRVGYTAPREHTLQWIYRRTDGFTTRTLGRNVTGSYELNYSFEITVESPETLSYLSFRVTTESKSQVVDFNVSGIQTQQTQYLSEPVPDYFNVKQVFEAPQDTDLLITIFIKEARSSLEPEIDDVDIAFEGVNTTTNPPTVFTQFIHNRNLTSALQKRESKSSNVTITIPYPDVQFGGYMLLAVSLMPNSTGLIERISHGVVVKILPYDSKTVVPENTVAVIPFRKQSFLGEIGQSLVCVTMGNPCPHVSIMKVSNGGKTKVLESETVFKSHDTQVKSFTFKHDPKTNNMEGRYLCRLASLRTQLDPLVFRAKLVELQMFLYEEFGPDLLTSKPNELYAVKQKNTKRSARVVLTVFPNETFPLTSFHTFICVARQGGIRETRAIELFPDDKDIQSTWDWVLLDWLNET